MQQFRNISITLPRQKIKKHVYYSTEKNCSNQKLATVKYSKELYSKQFSKSTNRNIKPTQQFAKLEQTLRQKNELLIKQSKWKNYYIKEEIGVLLDQILENLRFISNEQSLSDQVQGYIKKLEKTISKVQSNRNTKSRWIQFFGFSQMESTHKECEDKAVQTQQKVSQNIQSSQSQTFNLEISTLRQENKKLLGNLNVLTKQIQMKQKQISSLQQKYIKAKMKKQSLKKQLSSLKTDHHLLLGQLESKKLKQLNQQKSKLQSFVNKKHSPNKHFHKYSWDKNFVNERPKKFMVSEKNNVQEQSQNLFTLSDTPFVVEKNRQLPISTGYIQARRKLLSSHKQCSGSASRKSINGNINQSRQKSISIKEEVGSIQLQSKSKNQNGSNIQIQQEEELTYLGKSFLQEDNDESSILKNILLSQALTIQNLLERIGI